MSINQVSPDYRILSRFRTAITKSKAYKPLFKLINQQLENNQIIVKTGAIVDIYVIDTPLKPKGKMTQKVIQDRADNQESKSRKSVS